MAETRNELVLAQNQYSFIQDETKGLVQTVVGPYKTGLTVSDKSVKYDAATRKFVQVPLEEAILQNPSVSEDSYIVLENPAKDEKLFPPVGPQAPTALQWGRKINIPGPITFALWPGQIATPVVGHQLKSNEYIIVRVYNVEEAKKNWPKSALTEPSDLVVGRLLVIKGTDVSFFIPPTGLEVVRDNNTQQYVRLAVTLEQLEYCILLDENGKKRFEYGPQVVFPEATEKFVTRREDSATGQGGTTEKVTHVKFKAIELNDQMGIYVKIISPWSGPDYDGDVSKTKAYETGAELFITGRHERIYYPRAEHAVIEYGSETGSFKRQRYYAIAIPAGEARYVLDKNTGKVDMVLGPRLFLPDPRFQVIVRRVLDQRTVELWYPGNQEAIDYNNSLSAMAEGTQNYVSAASIDAAAMDLARSINRKGARSMPGQGANIVGETLQRGVQYTPPPQLTLNTKYDGPPSVSVWTGYAVQIVDKSGNRRVVKGPATVLLQYDETLERLHFSTGNPKTFDNPYHTVYLRTDHNKVSDTIELETRDMVTASVKVSYRVDFEGSSDKWFAVENYVKFFTDHIRSVLRAAAKRFSLKELLDSSSSIVRDAVLGAHDAEKKARAGHFFVENNMRIKDVEVLKLQILDSAVANIVNQFQTKAVQDTLALTAKQQELENAKVFEKISTELAELRSESTLRKIELQRQEAAGLHVHQLAETQEKFLVTQSMHKAGLVIEQLISEEAAEKLARRTASEQQDLTFSGGQTKLFVERMGAVDPKLTAAIEALSDRSLLRDLSAAVAPLAVMEQEGIGTAIRRLFEGTALRDKLEPLLAGSTPGNGHSSSPGNGGSAEP